MIVLQVSKFAKTCSIVGTICVFSLGGLLLPIAFAEISLLTHSSCIVLLSHMFSMGYNVSMPVDASLNHCFFINSRDMENRLNIGKLLRVLNFFTHI